jgi:uncharacterized membrane protein YeaQ/YmgE (transglycosylase-associated protein family)
MNEALAVLAFPKMELFALLLIGGATGWLLGRRAGSRHWFATLVLVGVAGSWLGSELAHVLGLAARGSPGHLVAALIGAVVMTNGWRKFHPE